MKNISYTTRKSPSLLRKGVALIVTVALIGLALMFSAIFIAVALIAGVIAWGYLWWRTRDLRKQMRNHYRGSMVNEDDVIEGEIIEGEIIESEVIEGEVIRESDHWDKVRR